jgi:hypothetical protein
VCLFEVYQLQQILIFIESNPFFSEKFNSHYLYYVSTILKYLLVVYNYSKRIRTAISTTQTREILQQVAYYFAYFYSKSSNNSSSIHRKKEVLFLFRYYVNQYRVHVQKENIQKKYIMRRKRKTIERHSNNRTEPPQKR